MDALVLALNPSIDAEWRVERVRWEEKNTVQSERRWAGGKGVNVARWLRHLQGRPQLLLPLGGNTGKELKGNLRGEKLEAKVVRLRENTRVNVIVTTNAEGQLRFNPPGPQIHPDEWASILASVRQQLRHASVMVLSGSLPRGLASDVYARLIQVGHEAGAKTILDCDGEALKKAISARPFLIKPNEHELGQWYGAKLSSEASILRAATALSTRTRGWVLVSLGKRGAILVNVAERAEFRASTPQTQVENTVGAGDALVAAVVQSIMDGAQPLDWLRWGVATGSAATRCRAGELMELKAIRELAGRIVVK